MPIYSRTITVKGDIESTFNFVASNKIFKFIFFTNILKHLLVKALFKSDNELLFLNSFIVSD